MISGSKNDAILEHRSRQRREARKPLVGDFVLFPDPSAENGLRTERISHHWGDDTGVQTSPGGSFYLGDGSASFSGRLTR